MRVAQSKASYDVPMSCRFTNEGIDPLVGFGTAVWCGHVNSGLTRGRVDGPA
jgi:hypothetical protein